MPFRSLFSIRLFRPLRSIAFDVAGNTLAMMAIALIPLAGLAGSAVDMSRSYMVKSRLQQACDAGALAARKSMPAKVLDSASATQGQNFFRINFGTNPYGTTGVTFTPTANAEGQVHGVATATLPMTIMKMFGNEQIALEVTCDAKLEVGYADVVMVLDITGSMDWCVDGNPSCAGGAGSRIEGIRAALLDFVATINGSTTAPASDKVRIGIVPYSSTVNVGGSLPPAQLVSNWTYQSRVANMTMPEYAPTTPGAWSAWTEETYGWGITSARCTKYGNNESFGGSNPFNPDPAGNPSPPTDMLYSMTAPSNDVTANYQFKSYSGTTCKRERKTKTTTYAATGRFGFTSWTLQPVAYDVSSFKTGSSVSVGESDSGGTWDGKFSGTVATSGTYTPQQLAVSATGGVRVSYAWNRCIEERDSTAATSFSSPLPADLDIDLAATTDATRWRPIWPGVLFNRSGTAAETVATDSNSNPSAACVSAARKLAALSYGDATTYAAALNPTGGTYHDIGMIWGARFLSATGMFASENVRADGKQLTRHLIFMTDGEMCPSAGSYAAHGLEPLDRRVAGAADISAVTGSCNDELLVRHNARFLAICDAVRGQNVTIWAVAFGLTVTPEMITCTDNRSDRYFTATNTTELKAHFVRIATSISDLRLAS